MEVGFFIGVALLAWLNHYIATRRGRNPIGWAIGGVFFGFLATILLLILGNTEEKEMQLRTEALNSLKIKE